MDIVTQYVESLAVARQRKAQLKDRQAELTEKLAALPEYQAVAALGEELKSLAEMIEDLEGNLRRSALEWAKANGERRHGAFVVKNFKVARYDVQAAVDWCYQHFREALTLDAKRFEKAADVLRPDFVTIETEQRVSIASDLSTFLPQEGAPSTQEN